MSTPWTEVSVILPAKDEQRTVGALVQQLRTELPGAEILVVDDGSTDATGRDAQAAGATVVRHPVSRGNGAAVKTGARHATRPVLVFMDADGQHAVGQIATLVAKLDEGFDMVIGARSAGSQASFARLLGNGVYNRLASWIVGHPVADLTSGMRAVRAARFREFLALLPNGFSYPTTITMAFYRAGYGVAFVPIPVGQRTGKSHIRLLHDGGRFLLIIFRVGTLYSPLKIFFPISLFLFLCGLAYCGYTLTVLGRFTNFAALLFITSGLVFLIGLVSEQITSLLYSQRG
jgi:glycosyltransferase involved in cell wall biosynthesis